MVSAPEHERRERGGLESEVMAALAAGDRPMTPREVQSEVAGDLAYTTVMTTLARLHDKGALRRRRDGRAYSYSLAGTSDHVTGALTARRMRRVLDAGGDRTVALTAFVSELGPDDERLLSMLLAKIEDETEPER